MRIVCSFKRKRKFQALFLYQAGRIVPCEPEQKTACVFKIVVAVEFDVACISVSLNQTYTLVCALYDGMPFDRRRMNSGGKSRIVTLCIEPSGHEAQFGQTLCFSIIVIKSVNIAHKGKAAAMTGKSIFVKKHCGFWRLIGVVYARIPDIQHEVLIVVAILSHPVYNYHIQFPIQVEVRHSGEAVGKIVCCSSSLATDGSCIHRYLRRTVDFAVKFGASILVLHYIHLASCNDVEYSVAVHVGNSHAGRIIIHNMHHWLPSDVGILFPNIFYLIVVCGMCKIIQLVESFDESAGCTIIYFIINEHFGFSVAVNIGDVRYPCTETLVIVRERRCGVGGFVGRRLILP